MHPFLGIEINQTRNAKNAPPIAETIGAPADLDAILAKLTAFSKDDRAC
jgi:hypothetical protein